VWDETGQAAREINLGGGAEMKAREDGLGVPVASSDYRHGPKEPVEGMSGDPLWSVQPPQSRRRPAHWQSVRLSCCPSGRTSGRIKKEGGIDEVKGEQTRG